MVLSAENIDAPKYVLIADTHAITNGLDHTSVDVLAGQYRETLERTLENLGFNGWQVIRASEIDQTSEYRDLLYTVNEPNDYVARELTDMLWFNQEHGVNLKIGWVLKGGKRDETSFDRKFQLQFDNDLGFIYIVPGRTLNPRRLHAAPYFCLNPKERIMLKEDEDVADKISSAKEKFGPSATLPCEKLLRLEVRQYEKTAAGKIKKGPIAERVQEVIYTCTK